MKIYNIITVLAFLMLIVLVSCELEEPDLQKYETSTGSLDLSSYVSLGNSLTAGYQSSSLVETHQVNSYPNLIARQLGITDFQQPLVSYPGIPNIMTFNPLTQAIGYASGTGAPLNLTLARPYDNLGIPGIVLADILNATSTASSFSHSAAIDLVLRNPSMGNLNVFRQAKMLQPKLLTLWIGNNDVLGFATSGGTSPATPTDAATFGALYTQLGDSVASLGAKVAVANIPNVTAIPFFTTIGPKIALALAGAKLQNPAIVGMFYQKHGEVVASSFTNFNAPATDPLITLVGSSYASYLGKPSGKWYRDVAAKLSIPVSAYLATLTGLDTTQAFGFHPQNPWPDALSLDAGEISTASTAIASFNSVISSVAAAKGFALFDANTFFSDVAANGYDPGVPGMDELTAKFVEGGLFSLDGVHPSDIGYAVIANEFIKAINDKFDVQIATVNLNEVSGDGQNQLAKAPNYDLSSMQYVIRDCGGDIK